MSENYKINEPIQTCKSDKNGIYHCETCLNDCPLNNDHD
jgi:hypothetical protein